MFGKSKKQYKEVKGIKKFRFNFTTGGFLDIMDYSIVSAQLRLQKMYPNFQKTLKNIDLL